MADRRHRLFPDRSLPKKQDDETDSVVYAETDDGWSQDERDGANDRQPTRAVLSLPTPSASTNLIDFDIEPSGQTLPEAEHVVKLHSLAERPTGSPEHASFDGGRSPFDLVSYPQARSALNPCSAEFSPSSPNAHDNADSQHELAESLEVRIRELEASHDTLQREKYVLDTVNKTLKHTIEKLEATTEQLKAKASEAELLRTCTRRYASDTSEKLQATQEALSKLQEEFEISEAQLEEYKKKYLGVAASTRPIEVQLQDLQTRLLNAVERTRVYEVFIQNFLAENSDHAPTFATIGLFPREEGYQREVAQDIDCEPLISFDEPMDATDASPKLQQGASAALIMEPCVNDSQLDSAKGGSAPKYLNDEHQTLQPLNKHPEKAHGGPSSHKAHHAGLEWNEDCENIWDSPFDRERSLRNHQGPTGTRHGSHTPGMFVHGVRYVRENSGQTLTTEDGIPDVASRLVILSGLPENVHIQRVLQHVRGGRILKAHTVIMGTGDNRYNAAYIEFIAAKDAMAYYMYTRRRDFGFLTDDGPAKIHPSLPPTDSFPLNEEVMRSLADGATRCLSVTGFPVAHLLTVLKEVGLEQTYVADITEFAKSDKDTFHISFSSVRTAILARKYIMHASVHADTRKDRSVSFRPDPCDAPLENLQVPFLPVGSTTDLASLLSDNAMSLPGDEEHQIEHQRRLVEIVAQADPEDDNTFQQHHLRHDIVWEKAANWDGLPEYMAYDSDQRRDVPHQRDPKSGAVRVKYHGSWVIKPDQSRKEWLHYNIDSKSEWTQKTADLFYAATGEIDQRKVNKYLESKKNREIQQKTDKFSDRLSSTMADS
ncbi:hypothetical protein CCHL11_07616 [Colletotrichum chlorophyti]|uniref:Uncharacterized protein n=1 Tax=Colletotrichum chlorophyti TaxID=708187 RepID=A0A1Q8RZM7_9PEZI|nr:hypothetical protein CCHL11_07616 [Colletotrichum chlorophyti]